MPCLSKNTIKCVYPQGVLQIKKYFDKNYLLQIKRLILFFKINMAEDEFKDLEENEEDFDLPKKAKKKSSNENDEEEDFDENFSEELVDDDLHEAFDPEWESEFGFEDEEGGDSEEDEWSDIYGYRSDEYES